MTVHRGHNWVSAAILSGMLGGCCFGGSGSSGAAPAAAPSMTIAPGFAPQPSTRQGNAYGGFVNGLDFGSNCRGMLPADPQHVIEVTAAIPELTVVVNGRGASGAMFDPTLVIRTPSGTALCDDDSEGRDPRIRAPFGPGRYEIFVGSYGSVSVPADADYVLGVSEADIMPSAIPEL